MNQTFSKHKFNKENLKIRFSEAKEFNLNCKYLKTFKQDVYKFT